MPLSLPTNLDSKAADASVRLILSTEEKKKDSIRLIDFHREERRRTNKKKSEGDELTGKRRQGRGGGAGRRHRRGRVPGRSNDGDTASHLHRLASSRPANSLPRRRTPAVRHCNQIKTQGERLMKTNQR